MGASGFGPTIVYVIYFSSKINKKPRSIFCGNQIRAMYRETWKINEIFSINQKSEIYARQCLMLLAITEPNCAFTVQSKAELYLDIMGNSHNRQVTGDYITQKSSVLSEMITDFSYAKDRANFINFEDLKFKDRDLMDDQFQAQFYLTHC